MDVENKAICTVEERVNFYGCDYKGRMKISTMLEIAAELAGYDYTKKGYGHQELLDKQMVFLLSRISLKINHYPTSQNTLKNSTWECGKQGALFLRGTEMVFESGEIAVSMKSGWVLANPVTRSIYKPSVYNFNMPQLLDKEITANDLTKISSNNLKLVGNRQVRISDLDENGHVYNARYADMASDVMTQEVFEKDVDNFRINYINEARLGDTIDLYADITDSGAVIIGMVLETICFQTEFIFK